MARLIDADALAEKKFQERECNGLGEGPAYRQGWNDAIDAVMDNEPSAQPERKRGEWILAEDGWYCSVCELYPPFDCDPEEKGIPYCPYCGAMMLKGEQDG